MSRSLAALLAPSLAGGLTPPPAPPGRRTARPSRSLMGGLGLWIALAALAALAGCDDGDACIGALQCEGPCPDLEAARAEVEAYNCDGDCAVAVYACDRLTVVSFGGLYSAEERFYDPGGALVARYTVSDVDDEACGRRVWQGRRIECGSCVDDDGEFESRAARDFLPLAGCP